MAKTAGKAAGQDKASMTSVKVKKKKKTSRGK
jgi:hypothetical protein